MAVVIIYIRVVLSDDGAVGWGGVCGLFCLCSGLFLHGSVVKVGFTGVTVATTFAFGHSIVGRVFILVRTLRVGSSLLQR